MNEPVTDKDLRSILSLDPLVAFWQSSMVPRCGHMAQMLTSCEAHFTKTPALTGDIRDPSVLREHRELLDVLMSVVFPAAAWESEIGAALKPFTQEAFYSTPAFRRLMLDDEATVVGSIHEDISWDFNQHRLLRAYGVLLKQHYGIQEGVDAPLVRIVPDATTGLDRYFRINPDMTFVRVGTVGSAPQITEADRHRIFENITDVNVLNDILPLRQFIFRGFTIARATDITAPYVTMKLERDLIDQQTIFSTQGFSRLQNRLRTLFERPDITAGIGGVHGEHVLIFNDGQHNETNCFFRNSSHIPMADLKDSIWLRVLEKGRVLRIADLTEKRDLNPVEEDLTRQGARSVMIMPLFYQDKPLGTMTIKSPQAGAFGPMDDIQLTKIAPIFSMALKRGLDDMNSLVQTVIKEKCTAVHPSVDWRFRQAAMAHMERMRSGETSEMEPIIFKDVVPLFGQSDIRGSSESRIQAIQADLLLQLDLAAKVLTAARAERNWPLLQEYNYRIDKRKNRIQKGLSSDDESIIVGFLNSELEPTFDELQSISPRVAHTVNVYRQALDPKLGVIFEKRKAFEQSVVMLNERLSTYLDQRQAEAQQACPHYFEKHQTDGIDYMIYLVPIHK